MYEFEEFVNKKAKPSCIPAVTITKTGIISFNKNAMLEHIGDHEYAVLYYDRKNNVIGIKLTNEEKHTYYKIRKDRNGTLGSISGVAFLKHYKVSYKETTAYKIEVNAESGMIIVKLNEKI